uniref:Putative ionotropic receptor ligand binding domain-containing protein n=1 Tax=Anopheles epiroticus TaxID=199890 RepID=A0A182PTF8_9DIPT
MWAAWTCTWLLLLHSTPAESTNSTLAKLARRFESTSTELLVSAAAEIVLQHYTTFNSKQMYLRREDGTTWALPITGKILRRTAGHLSVLIESKPPHAHHQTNASSESRLGQHSQLRVLNLLLVSSCAEFGRVADGLTDELYDFAGLYTVVLTGNDAAQEGLEVAGIILRTLWALYIVNVAVLIGPGQQDKDGGVQLYTYFPYGEDYCERALPVVWNVYERDGGFVHPARSPFPFKLRNFFNCPLVVATFPVFPFIIPARHGDAMGLEGIEGEMLRTLRQRLNFRLRVILVEPPDWGTAGPRDQATGASAYIRHRRANLTIGYWATTLHRNRYMASSFSYYTSQLVLVVAPGDAYTSLELLRCPFGDTIWTLLLCTLAVGLAVIGCLRCKGSRALQRLVLGDTPSSAWPGMVSVLLGAGLSRAPQRNFARTLLLCWLAGTLVLRSAYTGSMIRFLQSDRNHSVPGNVPALLAAHYELLMYRNYSFVFDAYPRIGRQLRLITTQQFRHVYVDQLQLPGKRLAMLLPLETVTYLNRNLTRDGQLLRIVRERVYVAKLAIYTQRSSALLAPFNNLLERFVSSGLLYRWASQYHQARFLANPYRYHGGDDQQQLVLTEIDGPFAILLTGLVLSTVTFLVELVVGATRTLPPK